MGLVLRSAASLAIPAHLSDNSPPAAEEPLRLASDAAPPLSAGRPSSNDGAQLGPKSRLDLVDAGPFSAGGLAPKPRLRKSDKKEDVFFILIDMHPVFRKQTSYYLYHIITCYSLNNEIICMRPLYQFIICIPNGRGVAVLPRHLLFALGFLRRRFIIHSSSLMFASVGLPVRRSAASGWSSQPLTWASGWTETHPGVVWRGLMAPGRRRHPVSLHTSRAATPAQGPQPRPQPSDCLSTKPSHPRPPLQTKGTE